MNLVKKVIKCSRTVELIQKALNVGDDLDSLKSRTSLLLHEIVLNELNIFIAKLELRLSCSQISRIKLLYVRYAKESLVFVIGTKLDANHTRLQIKDFLSYKGLSFNMGEIVNTASGFTFLGAICKWVSKKISNDSKENTRRMYMNVDSHKIYKKLVERNIARFSNHSPRIPQGTANNSIITFSHVDILNFFNTEVRELISYYTFVSNKHILKGIIWQIYRSCALTLAKKHKLRTMSASFKKFGKSLDCPLTGRKFYKPKFLLTNKYRVNISERRFSSSSSKDNSTIQNTLAPYFITGLTDAEGCFRLKISKNSKYTLG